MVSFRRPAPNLGTEDDVLLKRIAAFLIDFFAFFLIGGIITNLIALVSELLGLILTGIGTILFVAYFIYFEAEYGQTVGKMMMDIVVVTEAGDPIGYREALIRTLLRAIDVLPMFYILGLIVMYLTDRQQRIGDILASTVVLEVKDRADPL